MSSAEHLTQMANDIGHFFSAQGSREEAIAGIVNHINSFWTRRMRETLIANAGHGEEGLDELPRAALQRIIQRPDAQPNQSPGGDAG
jgi:formate dehydrogenase subunit delta